MNNKKINYKELFPNYKLTKEEKDWCDEWHNETLFTPEESENVSNSEEFKECVRKSLSFFKLWSSDMENICNVFLNG